MSKQRRVRQERKTKEFFKILDNLNNSQDLCIITRPEREINNHNFFKQRSKTHG